jgi:DNA polymerase I-like protein with 3'-5' exonuclease and polymerase domains
MMGLVIVLLSELTELMNMLGRCLEMMLAGKFMANGSEMFLCMYSLKDSEFFALLSPYHKEDAFEAAIGGETKHVVIREVKLLSKYYDPGYVVEAIKRLKKSGTTEAYGTPNVLLRVLDGISFARSYRFNKKDVFTNERNIELGEEVVSFDAADENLEFNFEKHNDEYSYLRVKTSNIEFELNKMEYRLPLKKLTYSPIQKEQSKKVMVATLKDISFDILDRMLDMSWYKKDGVLQKDYKSICTKQDFELKIMRPLAKKIIECQKTGKQLDVAVDTETDGLLVYNLSKDNPDKCHCVAVPICWEVGHSNVIFTDMEHFDNVPNEYVSERLAELFENFKGERTLEYLDYSESSTNEMTAFGGEENKSGDKLVKKSVVFERDTINLIGHNSPFDGRVFFDLGKKFYFNNNTLQMAFDINPVTVRGSKKLKVLTRLFFHHETPELEDVLGKGNEDKYRYLADREVAEIYGCADADYTLACFYKLRSLMSDKMYYWYQRQDVPMDNILYQSEYWGMNTVQEKVQELAEQNYQNIEILKNAMYSYVGVFVQYSNELKVLKLAWESGKFKSEEEYKAAVDAVVPDPNARYEFEFKPAQLRTVLYDIMKYPIKAYTEGKKRLPKIDKYAISKLLRDELKEGDIAPRKLQADILVYGATHAEVAKLRAEGKGKKADSLVLISAKQFNSLKYPLALIIQKYTELNKEYTGYYKPMAENNLEGKIFKGYNMARIETRRISNPGQTMKGSLKAVVKPYSDDDYLLDFDMAQIEYRIMLSLAKFEPMIKKMCNPENDYHTETASMVEGKPAYRISKKERKKAKSVSFGVPYGLGDASMCETMFKDRSKEHMVETRVTLHKWRQQNKPIIDLLEKSRAEALTEWKISDDLREFMDAYKKDENGEYLLDAEGKKIPSPISKCENILGFYRTFSLEGVDLSPAGAARRAQGEYTPEEASIRRKAGNYPIQATAAEIFRIILIRFYQECEKYGIQDKVKWYMLIHDELLCSVKNDVNPMLIYKIVKKACMITMKGHTKYFVGINMGDSWASARMMQERLQCTLWRE